ncbi:MAG: nucleotidyltransferase domain-containing protein [Lachnospiraceae bacterium]|nr:nucleotidyltransferase domain-containing protein [Lachnospiraceae bacterium]
MNNFKNMWDFPIVDGVSLPDANRIHPLMQKRVEMLVQVLKEDGNIRRIVLFGSSLEFRCDSYSDIDLYIEKYDPDTKLCRLPDLDCGVDIVTNQPHTSRLYQEIDRTGLLLFDREQAPNQ